MTINEEDQKKEEKPPLPLRDRARREIMAWFWIILAFLFVYSTIGQARVIPSGSMEDTLLVGDHLLMSRFGYDAGIPFTSWHVSLWRNPKRGQIIIFRSVEDPNTDLVKRVIGMPGDTVEVREDGVWIDGKKIDEPYIKGPMLPRRLVPATKMPPDCYWAMGDNRNNSNDSRYWGCVPRANIIGVPVMIYLSINAPSDNPYSDTSAWEPGHIGDRFAAYGGALIHPSRIRWKRLFHFF